MLLMGCIEPSRTACGGRAHLVGQQIAMCTIQFITNIEQIYTAFYFVDCDSSYSRMSISRLLHIVFFFFHIFFYCCVDDHQYLSCSVALDEQQADDGDDDSMSVAGKLNWRRLKKDRVEPNCWDRRACSHMIRFAADPSSYRLPVTVLTHVRISNVLVSAAGEMAFTEAATSAPSSRTATKHKHNAESVSLWCRGFGMFSWFCSLAEWMIGLSETSSD